LPPFFRDLSNKQLTGNIPSNLGNATYLFTLNLSQNKLNESIPGATGTDGLGLSVIAIFDLSVRVYSIDK
jgi:hypothetical protein